MDKVSSALGLAKKAGKLLAGFDSVVNGIRSGEVCLMALSSDLSAKSRKEAVFFAQKGEVVWIELPLNMDQIASVLHRRTGILGILDEQMARLIRKTVTN